MKQERLFLSVRLWHPFINAEEIVNNINREPNLSQTFGTNYMSPSGKKTNRINKETYIVYDFQNDIVDNDLSDAIQIANAFLFENINYLNIFKKSGGRCDYYITIESERKYVFTMTPEVLNDCAKLGIEIGVEIFINRQAIANEPVSNSE
jgi:hypothetical protein